MSQTFAYSYGKHILMGSGQPVIFKMSFFFFFHYKTCTDLYKTGLKNIAQLN